MEHTKKNPFVIIINGQPCTGKSHLLSILSNDFNLIYISRDEIKEQLFDVLGVRDSQWSKKLGEASYALFFSFLEKLLIGGNNFILEGNFNPIDHRQKLKSLFDQYSYDTVEVLLTSDPEILIERFKARWVSGERHKGHADNERFIEFEKRFKETKQDALKINEKLINIDTTDFNSVNYKSLVTQLKIVQDC
jgi:predicted kinase